MVLLYAVSTVFQLFYPLPDDKILGFPNLKAFADDNSNVTQNIKVVFHRIEKVVVDWLVFYAAFNSISAMLFTLFMVSWVSPVLDWAPKCLAQGHSHEKTQRI